MRVERNFDCALRAGYILHVGTRGAARAPGSKTIESRDIRTARSIYHVEPEPESPSMGEVLHGTTHISAGGQMYGTQ